MSSEILRQAILEKVSRGAKDFELWTKLDANILDSYSEEEILAEANRLVEAGEIIEVKYTLPHMDYRRNRSFYVLKGTEIVVVEIKK